MLFVYSYKARNSFGQIVAGHIHAESSGVAFARLQKAGLKPFKTALDLPQTLKGLLSRGFDLRELARLYATLGKREKNGRSLTQGLESALQYLKDPTLRQAVMLLRQGVEDSRPLGETMKHAGFPPRDAMLCEAALNGGSLGDALINMSEEIKKKESLRRSIASTFRMPKIMAFMMFVGSYAAIHWSAPMSQGFLKKVGGNKSVGGFIDGYFKFAEVFNANITVATALYLAAPIPVILFFKSSLFRKLLDNLKVTQEMSIKADHQQIWSSFALMYESNVSVRDICRTLAGAASRPDTRASLLAMASHLDNRGGQFDELVERANFPPQIAAGVQAAYASGAVAEGLRQFCGDLEEDLNILTESVRNTVQLLSLVVMGAAILGFFMVTYYPIGASAIGNL